MNNDFDIDMLDNSELRTMIVELCNRASKKTLALWAMELSKHAFGQVAINYKGIPYVIEGFIVSQMWQEGNASISDIRRECFQIEKYALTLENSSVDYFAIKSSAQAVGTPAVVGRCLACSDFAIKSVSAFTQNNEKAINKERRFQVRLLSWYIDKQ